MREREERPEEGGQERSPGADGEGLGVQLLGARGMLLV